jgi:hypothetical protein
MGYSFSCNNFFYRKNYPCFFPPWQPLSLLVGINVLTDLEPFLAVPTLTPLVGINVLQAVGVNISRHFPDSKLRTRDPSLARQ